MLYLIQRVVLLVILISIEDFKKQHISKFSFTFVFNDIAALLISHSQTLNQVFINQVVFDPKAKL